MSAEGNPGVLADVTRILATHHISVEALIQKEAPADENHRPVILLTHKVLERALNGAIAKIEALPSINMPVKRIQMETLR